MNHFQDFPSEKHIYYLEGVTKIPTTPFKSNKKRFSCSNLTEKNIKTTIKEENEEEKEKDYNEIKYFSTDKKIKEFSPNIKQSIRRSRRFSTKDFFRDKKYFSLEKRFYRKGSRKLSTRNTRIFSELIRHSIIKRQNEEERFHIIIKCLITNFKLRTFEDLSMIKSFIKENKISHKIVYDKMNNENEKLFQALSYEMEYKFIAKNNKLFEISQKVDNIYLIVKGRVELYEHSEYKVELTLYKYMKYIYNLYNDVKDRNDNLELYKLKKTIESNSEIIKVSLEDIPYFICLLVKNKFNIMINNNNYNIFIEDLEEIIYDCRNDRTINLKNFEFDREKRNDEIYIKDIVNNLYKKIPKISRTLIDKYFSILKDKEHEFYTFKKFTLRKICELKEGDYLGEETLDNNLERKCSVIALEDTHLGYIDFDLYHDIVNKYQEIIKDKDAKFLKDSFYFKRISLQYFIKNYFSDFAYQELTYGNHILNQKSSFENIYFLKEGVIEVYCNKSVVEIISLVTILSQKLKNNIAEEIRSELLSINNKLYIYGRLNHNFTIKNTSRLLIIPNADILGIESWITNMPYFYNCKIISDKAKFFKISLAKINNLFSYLKEGKEQFSEDANNRLELLCRRLIKIIHIKIQYFNKFNNYKDTQKKRLIPNIIKKDNNNNNNTTNNILFKKKLFSSKKIKDLLFEKSKANKEKENEYNKHHKSPFFYLTFTNMGYKRI